jgi:1,2-dihydroxy-3-keto-5-methylthiopentene dioxygenase
MSKLSIYSDQDAQTLLFETEEGYEIQSKLNELGIRFERWSANTPITPAMQEADILDAYAEDIQRLKDEDGYIVVDAVSMYPDHPQKDVFRQKFLSEHTHSEDEVRFFVAGQGLFCLHIQDHVYQVLCCEQDLISVPKGTAHWFDMGSHPQFTALRLFNDPAGWVAQFTGDVIASHFPTLP